jgi:hypothetical protein
MTIKRYLKNLHEQVKDLYLYFKAIFTNRHVFISLCVALGGMVGWSLIDLLRVAAFSAWGPATLPYTSSPLSILALVVVGGVVGLIVSESRAVRHWYKDKKIAAMPALVSAVEVVEVTEPVNLDPLAFDPETGILSFHGKTCKIPFQSKQQALCQKCFERPGERVMEYDILLLIDQALAVDPAKAGRIVRDAVYAVNEKAEEALGIEELFIWSKLTVWINEKYA